MSDSRITFGIRISNVFFKNAGIFRPFTATPANTLLMSQAIDALKSALYSMDQAKYADAIVFEVRPVSPPPKP
jgi:hypothetical protein